MTNLNKIKTCAVFLLFFLIFFTVCTKVYATVPAVDINVAPSDNPASVATSIQLLFVVAIVTLAPSLLMMVTCFPRILICFHFVRAALGTQQVPPNQILIALALFMTFAYMGNTFTQINDDALQPLINGEITQEVAFERGMEPIREFMGRNVTYSDVALFMDLTGRETVSDIAEVPNEVLIPAFLLGEITKGFEFGVNVYLPFIVIDMVVASILMAMGMMMLPPAMISLPFKILLFISVGGWSLTVESIMKTFA
ncbi:MAG: flagellar type III secretion system pore protein FliP [Clostridiales bacterium]|jgi:flagellar biosynthetic protein FliP|nr:flagellar type III secretion system pore protein FliP [Clostridiales bacterium]